MTPVLLAVGAFIAMEGISAVTHRRLMHGPGMVWHRSHHRPGTGGFERNDLFPVCFSAVGVALFATARAGGTARFLRRRIGAVWTHEIPSRCVGTGSAGMRGERRPSLHGFGR